MGTPLLRPGARLLRRDADHLQLGLDPAHAVVVTDTPEHRGLLSAWCRGELTDLLPTHPLGRRLVAAGLVVEADEGRVGRDRYAAAARLLRPGEETADARPVPVRLEVYGGEPGALLARRLAALLAEAAVPLAPEPAGPSGLAVLIGVGQPSRERLDPWLRDHVPHLVVRIDEGDGTVGPFVSPGRTACLRCLDAHHGERDPRWPLLVEQHARWAGLDRGDGVPEPVDPTVAALVTAWAARDLLAWRTGATPSTWSATLRVGPDGAAPTTQTWPRHPGCGCGWDLSATMAV